MVIILLYWSPIFYFGSLNKLLYSDLSDLIQVHYDVMRGSPIVKVFEKYVSGAGRLSSIYLSFRDERDYRGAEAERREEFIDISRGGGGGGVDISFPF